MKILIIPIDRVEKLKSYMFPKGNVLGPQKGFIDGKEVYFLQAELKEDWKFQSALADFEVCEVKDIEAIEQKYYDAKNVEIKPNIEGKYLSSKGIEVSPMDLTAKTILTITK